MMSPADQQKFAAAIEQKVQELSAAVKASPSNCHKELAMWGQLLLELAMMSNGPEAEVCVVQAIEKLESAIKQEEKEEYVAALGNALNVRAFTVKELANAQPYFDGALKNFERAKELSTDPSMAEKYEKMIGSIKEAPKYHAKIMQEMEQQQQAQSQQQATVASPSSMGPQAGPAQTKLTPEQEEEEKKRKRTQLMYDIAGWGIVVVGAFALLRYFGQH